MLNNYLIVDFYVSARFVLSPSNVPACNGALQSFTCLCKFFLMLPGTPWWLPVNIYYGMHNGDSIYVLILMQNCVVLYTAFVVDGHAFHVELIGNYTASIMVWPCPPIHPCLHIIPNYQLHSLVTADTWLSVNLSTINVMVDTGFSPFNTSKHFWI